MADKFMYISNVDTQNTPFCRLQLVVETFGHSTNKNSIKVVEQTNKKTLL